MYIINAGLKFAFRKNVKVSDDVCPHCGWRTDISSFDAFRFFHVLRIPLIPIGKFHVEGMCRICHRHERKSFSEWMKEREDFVAAEKTRPPAADAASAIAHHRAVTRYMIREYEIQAADRILQTFPADRDVLAYLGRWYATVWMNEASVDCFERLLKQAPSDDARRGLAFAYSRLDNRPLARSAYMAMDRPDAREDFMPMLHLAVKMRRAGEHRDAYSLLSYVHGKLPERAVEHALFRSEARALERKLGMVKSLVGKRPGAKREALIAAIVVGFITASALLANLFMYYFQFVAVANGTSRTATVSFAPGKKATIKPRSVETLTIKEGTYDAVVTFGDGTRYIRRVTFENDFLARFYKHKTYVFNIRGAAIVVWGEVLFMRDAKKKTEKDTAGLKYSVHTGRELIYFTGVDYPFDKAPEEISLEKGEDRKIKTELVLMKHEPVDMLKLLVDAKEVTGDDLLAFMEGQIGTGYQNAEFNRSYRVFCGQLRQEDRYGRFLAGLSSGRK